MSTRSITMMNRILRCLCITVLSFPLVPAWAQEANNPVPDIVKVTAQGLGLGGGDVDIQTHVFKPAGSGPFPVVLFSHGRSGEQVERANLKNPLAFGHVRYRESGVKGKRGQVLPFAFYANRNKV